MGLKMNTNENIHIRRAQKLVCAKICTNKVLSWIEKGFFLCFNNSKFQKNPYSSYPGKVVPNLVSFSFLLRK